MSDSTSESSIYEEAIKYLVDPGLAVIDTNSVNREWAQQCEFRLKSDDFTRAQVGSGPRRSERPDIRGDLISWLQESNPIESQILAWLNALRVKMNAELSLGMNTVEAHWALYPPGGGYLKHFDQSPFQKDRIITFIYYLNERWSPDDGGELEVFEPLEGPTHSRTISPIAGRWVFFKSDAFPHQVLPTKKARKSLTGWFKVKDQSRL